MARTRFNRVVAGTFAAAALAVVATAGPAAALPIDQPLISTSGSDFGANLVNGVPLNGGVFDWNQVAGNPVISPQLTGTLYLQQPAGVQAHMEIKYYSASHAFLGSRVGGTKTATAAATDSFPINLGGFGNANVAHAHVELWDNDTGVMQLRGTAIVDL